MKVSHIWKPISVLYKIQTISELQNGTNAYALLYLWKLLHVHVSKLAVTHGGREENRYIPK